MDRYYMESLRNLAILEMILRNKQRIKKQPWDKECKVFIGGLKYNVYRTDVTVSILLKSACINNNLFRIFFHNMGMWSIVGLQENQGDLDL